MNKCASCGQERRVIGYTTNKNVAVAVCACDGPVYKKK